MEFFCFNPLDRGNLYQIRSSLFGVLRNEFGLFQSPRSGEFVSNAIMKKIISFTLRIAFQSPRSGKFVSNANEKRRFCDMWASFNPLDRGIYIELPKCNTQTVKSRFGSFNPLDRGNLYQITKPVPRLEFIKVSEGFQSPRSGKFVSNLG